MSDAKLKKGAWIGSVCLVILVFQNSLFFYATHEGRVPDKDGNVYYAPTMVVIVELLKAIISFAILYYQQFKKQGSIDSSSYTLLQDLSGREGEEADAEEKEPENAVSSNRYIGALQAVWALIFANTAWKIAIPATLYVIQTNLAVIGAQNLDSTSFIIASQLKFATTALCTSIMLNRVIGTKRWMSLGTLSAGVLLVQLQGQKQIHNAVNDARNPVIGLISIIVACFISGFAAIFLEKILKNGTSNLWATNIQLGCFGLVPAVLPVINDAWQNGYIHPFQHFGLWAWTTVEANVMGGLVVALIMKYADNIQKSMAISVSIVLTFLITVAVGKAELQLMAVLGAAVVIGSILVYNRSAPPVAPPSPSQVAATESQQELTHVMIQKGDTKA